jgi:hypothetical protein
MPKFKRGDKVKIMSVDFGCRGTLRKEDIGKVCTVTCDNKDDDKLYILNDNEYEANFPEDCLELVKKHKSKNPTHIVIWDEEDRDPHQFFTSEKEAREFIKELSEKSNVMKDSIILVEIKSAQKVNIIRNVRLNQYKV